MNTIRVYAMTSGINESQDQYLAESTAGLVFPWGRISIDATLASPSGAVLPSLDTGPANLATPPYGGSIAGPAALPNQTNIQTERPMDLAGILGGITQTASTIRDVRNILNPPIMGQQLQQAIPPGVGTTQVSLPSVLGGAVLGEAAESIYEYFAEPGLPAGVNGAAAACATKPSDIVYKWSEKDQRYVARKKIQAQTSKISYEKRHQGFGLPERES